MATAASRYYSEDGRATKRQKTDGMATVSRGWQWKISTGHPTGTLGSVDAFVVER